MTGFSGALVQRLEQEVFVLGAKGEGLLADRTDFIDEGVADLFLEGEHVVVFEHEWCLGMIDSLQS